MLSIYEHHTHPDPDFPIIFHRHVLMPTEGMPMVYLHWHESVEVLCFFEGTGVVVTDTRKIQLRAGEIAIINSNCLHAIYPLSPTCSYYCLIVDTSLCRQNGILVENMHFQESIRDDRIFCLVENVFRELTEKGPFYKAAVKSAAISLFVLLARDHSSEWDDYEKQASQNKKTEIVKKAIAYIRQHFQEDISLDDICEQTGYNRYYFCHVFKEVTGQTILAYVNFVRCSHAKKLLLSGTANVAESAEQSGFRNQSYFTRIFKKQMGMLPSQVGQNKSLVKPVGEA